MVDLSCLIKAISFYMTGNSIVNARLMGLVYLRHINNKCNACYHIHHVTQNVDDYSNVDILLFHSKEYWQKSQGLRDNHPWFKDMLSCKQEAMEQGGVLPFHSGQQISPKIQFFNQRGQELQ